MYKRQDVDGAHIRTLLLTFFYRQMPELVDRGYIYIAQPPLYKIKHGKSERYIKDDHELNQHLLKLALDGAELLPREGAAAIAGDALDELARAYLLAEAVITRLTDFIDSQALHALLAQDIELSLADEIPARASAERLTRAIAMVPEELPVVLTVKGAPSQVDAEVERGVREILQSEPVTHVGIGRAHVDGAFAGLDGNAGHARCAARLQAGAGLPRVLGHRLPVDLEATWRSAELDQTTVIFLGSRLAACKRDQCSGDNNETRLHASSSGVKA